MTQFMTQCPYHRVHVTGSRSESDQIRSDQSRSHSSDQLKLTWNINMVKLYIVDYNNCICTFFSLSMKLVLKIPVLKVLHR